ncbi:MAG: hypothetical protein DHS20C19_16140 [Acidimicrobiales bacterium]|nr:MAG: hypothetical protein DHS20C19_16140 [Acidimicrobiales bacterium]
MRVSPVLLALVLVVSACGDDGDTSPATSTTGSSTTSTTSASTTTAPTTTAPAESLPYVPGDDWETVDADTAGFDAAGLSAATQLAEDRQSHCLLVLREGRIVHEWYGDGASADDDFSVFSVTKSVSAAIVGSAVRAGHLAVDEPASTYLDEWVGTDSESVTIEQILQNISGRLYDPVPDLFELGNQPDMTTHSIGLTQERDPGTAWFYNQSAIQTLEAIVERATGEDTGEFAETALFDPIGMDVAYSRDDAGNLPMFAGLRAGCRDLGRFALLTARGGAWGGTQLIGADYMAAAITGTEINNAYGYLYWHNAEPGTWDHTNPGRDRAERFWPDLPIDAYGANGLGEQFATVFPTEDVIVVRIGAPAGVQGYEGVLANDLAAAVYDAIVS